MQLLIIYEEVPESLKIYTVNTENPQLIAELQECHGNFVNAVDCSSEIEERISNIDTFATLIYDSTKKSTTPELHHFVSPVQIIHTGFLL